MANTALGRLAGKRAIVTGAGSGIGRASAQLFAAEGARVLAADTNATAVAETVAAISKAGGTAQAAEADAGAEDHVKSLVARARGLGWARRILRKRRHQRRPRPAL